MAFTLAFDARSAKKIVHSFRSWSTRRFFVGPLSRFANRLNCKGSQLHSLVKSTLPDPVGTMTFPLRFY
jgi:hypothetical protein